MAESVQSIIQKRLKNRSDIWFSDLFVGEPGWAYLNIRCLTEEELDTLNEDGRGECLVGRVHGDIVWRYQNHEAIEVVKPIAHLLDRFKSRCYNDWVAYARGLAGE